MSTTATAFSAGSSGVEGVTCGGVFSLPGGCTTSIRGWALGMLNFLPNGDCSAQ